MNNFYPSYKTFPLKGEYLLFPKYLILFISQGVRERPGHVFRQIFWEGEKDEVSLQEKQTTANFSHNFTGAPLKIKVEKYDVYFFHLLNDLIFLMLHFCDFMCDGPPILFFNLDSRIYCNIKQYFLIQGPLLPVMCINKLKMMTTCRNENKNRENYFYSKTT